MVDGIQELVNVLQTDTAEPSKTYSAEVSSIDNEGTVWVYLEGANTETPTAMSSSEVAVGDNVNVEWRNNKLYIAGNVSNPSAGTIRVRAVEQAAQIANQAAQSAVADAGVARQAAEQAQTIANSVRGIAEDAQADADQAKASAENAQASAIQAHTQLSFVEDIVGVLDLIAKNGNYQPTVDEEVQPNKWYFQRISGSGTSSDPYIYQEVEGITSVYHLTNDTAIDINKTYYTRTGTGTSDDPYIYIVVETPVVADIGTYYEKYYELTGIDSSIQNYVSSHLVLTSNGLSLRTDGSNYRLDLTTTGMNIIGANGQTLASYGTSTVVGDARGFHVQIDSGELGFYQGSNRVAYINGNRLYITQSVVLQQMDVGRPTTEIDPATGQYGLGQWSWKVHEVNGRNNLYLKWLG